MYTHPEPPEGEGSDPPEVSLLGVVGILVLAAMIALLLGYCMVGSGFYEEVEAVQVDKS